MAELERRDYLRYSKPLADIKKKVSFSEVWGAQMPINYQPWRNWYDNMDKYGGERDASWTVGEVNRKLNTDDVRFLPFAGSLRNTNSIEHYNAIKNQIDERMEHRKIAAQGSFWQHLGVGVLDPINLATIPIGGPISASFLKQGVRTSFSAMTPVATAEIGSHIFDPTRTTQETALNIGAGTAFTFLLGGMFSTLGKRRDKVFNQMQNNIESHINDINSVSTKQFMSIGNRNKRTYKKLNNEQIETLIKSSKIDLENAKANLAESTAAKKFNKSIKIPRSYKAKITSLENKILDLEGEITVRNIEDTQAGKDVWKYNDNWFTDSFAFKMITTPAKRIFQSKELGGAANDIKHAGVLLFGDMAINHRANALGIASPLSVHAKSATSRGRWVKHYDELVRLYGEHTGQPVTRVMDYQLSRNKAMIEFMETANRKRLFGIKGDTEAETKAIRVFDRYYNEFESDLIKTKMMRNVSQVTKDIVALKVRVADLEKEVSISKGRKRSIKQQMLDKASEDLYLLELSAKDAKIVKEPHFPRFWNIPMIKKYPEEFLDIAKKHFRKNHIQYITHPKTGKVSRIDWKKEGKMSEDDIAQRAKETMESIINIKDITDIENLFLGAGNTTHLKHRSFDIPNTEVYKFIQTQPIDVMMTYNKRMSAHLHMFENFGLTNKEDFFLNLRKTMRDHDVPEHVENAMIRDFDSLYRRVHSVVLDEPDTWSQQTRRFVTEAAQLSYLGTAGLASLTDFAKITMEHNMGDMFKVLFNMMDNQKISLNAKEARLAGEILEILMADSHLRFSENVINNPFMETSFQKITSKVRNTFFFANALAPITNIAKRMDAMIRVHSIIEMAVQIDKGVTVNGKFKKGWGSLSKLDRDKLLRHGLDEKIMKRIAKAPFEQTEIRKVAGRDMGGLYLANTEKWVANGISKDTLNHFRTAINQGIQNTVMLGTPADKPIAVDGVFYVRIGLAKHFGFKEDKLVKGYARIEQGLSALPFQFYSYSFAAMNKVTAAFAHNGVKNRTTAIIAAMGLGYMGLSLKNYNRQWVMDNMTIQDKIARSFDMSGLAALYTDMFYTLGGMAKDAFDVDMLGKVGLQRKGPDGNMLDAITGVTGAGTSWSLDMGRALQDFYNGNWSEGGVEVLKLAPFNNTLFFRDDISWLGSQVNKSRF